jgi:hypothetical protein
MHLHMEMHLFVLASHLHRQELTEFSSFSLCLHPSQRRGSTSRPRGGLCCSSVQPQGTLIALGGGVGGRGGRQYSCKGWVAGQRALGLTGSKGAVWERALQAAGELGMFWCFGCIFVHFGARLGCILYMWTTLPGRLLTVPCILCIFCILVHFMICHSKRP